jgi:hemoglobin
MKDIETRADIDRLMVKFYKRAIADDVIGYIFTDVARLNLKNHLPVIGDFWETLLFGTGDYQKHERSPLQVHARLSEKSLLQFEHFNRWREIFARTVDEMFAGTRADFAKMRADAIANRMLDYVSNAAAKAV